MQEHGSADAPDTGRECREGSTENHPFLHKIVKNQRFSEMITRGVEATAEGVEDLNLRNVQATVL